ncbi:hypothetical protein DVA67_011830 [Solirubrobacter sp. CPCC 204708]|uniref:DUF305 domain-containing protein n=1 Tax=Solirubrobacter deserti TaxID=2282478 RepID=A0ABT4RPX0_9ACTN|nr:hypothetical protein [Solirubrobacter deserti]MBE2316668.1 hypothetical protein [Solirubrobacter deserti]MDA0140566.1 hypothetical protein [Solirubrobacter deserti]
MRTFHGDRATRLRVLAPIAISLTVAACGGDDNTADTIPAAARFSTQPLESFQQQAAPLCSQASAAMAKVELPSSFPADLEEFDTKSQAMLAAIEQPFRELAALKAPHGHEAVFEEFKTALESAVSQTEQLRELVEAGNDDTDALGLPRTNVKTHASQAMEAAETLQVEACTQLSFKEASHG